MIKGYTSPSDMVMRVHETKRLGTTEPHGQKKSAGSGYSSQQQGAVKASVLQMSSNKQAGDKMIITVRIVFKSFLLLLCISLGDKCII